MSDIGLECTVNSGLKVFGIFKQLWEDFHVREIRRDGDILQLTQLLDQNIIRAAHVESLELEAGTKVISEEFRISPEERQRLQSECYFNDSAIDTLEQFIIAVARVKAVLAAADESVASGVEEAAYQGLSNCHGIILPAGNLPPAESKSARKAMHEVIRELFPFLETETATTGDLYEKQQKPQLLQTSQTVNLEDECAEAATLSRIYEPKEFLQKVNLKPHSEETLLNEMLTFDYAAHKASISETSGNEDVIKFLTLKLKKVAIHHIVGRSLHSAPSSKDSAVKWNSTLPPYLQFTVLKQNRDVSEAIQSMSSATGIPEKNFSYAGTKDKRGCTVQRMSLFRTTKSRLLNCTIYRSWDRAIKISDLEYSHNRVALGDLIGNHFTIAIRRIPATMVTASEMAVDGRRAVADHIAKLVEGLKENGFINYYGNQRFGTRRIRTWQVGAELFRRNYRKAVELILSTAVDLPELEEDQHHDWAAVDSMLRPFHHNEKKMVKALRDNSKNYCSALQKLHKNNLALYYHALQSLVWNKMASERFKRFGPKIVIGDVVILPLPTAAPESSEEMSAELNEDAAITPEIEDLAAERGPKFAVKLIETEEQAATFAIQDLCLPIPGPNVTFPTNISDTIEELLAEYFGMTTQELTQISSDKHLVTIEGSYRRVIVKPDNVAHKIVHDAEEMEPLIASDLDRLLGKPIAARDDFNIGLKPLSCQIAAEAKAEAGAELSEATTRTAGSNEPQEAKAETSAGDSKPSEAEHDEKKIDRGVSDVLLFSCSLPRGSYLTCLLRELLDEGSIADFMACKENKFFKDKSKDSNRTWKRGASRRGGGGGPNKRRR